MTRLDWERAARRKKAGPPVTRNRPAKITNSQAKALARLQREAGDPYTGHGLTAVQAKALIDDYKARKVTNP